MEKTYRKQRQHNQINREMRENFRHPNVYVVRVTKERKEDRKYLRK